MRISDWSSDVCSSDLRRWASRPHEQLLETRSRMHPYRTHHCAELRASDVGGKVRLSGWVHRKRDHGNLLFVDLRDHHGITQIVADVDSEAFALLEGARAESVLKITGDVVEREPGKLKSGRASGRERGG